MRRPSRLLSAAAAALLVFLPTARGLDAFLEIRSSDAIATGGSSDPLYAGWITVLGFDQSAVNDSTVFPSGSQRSVLRPFQISKPVDSSTPVLSEFLFQGRADLSVHLVVVNQTPGRVELWDIRCSPAVLSNLSVEASAGGTLLESLSVTAGTLEVAYITTDPGNGGALAELYASFNAQTQILISGTRAPMFRGDVDTDGDGIPDSVERFYGLDPFTANSNLDSDGDGLTNLQEYIAGTNLKAANSVFKVTQTQSSVGSGTTTLTWKSESGRIYLVERAATLAGPFTTIKTLLSTGPGTMSTTVANPGPTKSFFRVRALQQ